jgi:hypothetical protein
VHDAGLDHRLFRDRGDGVAKTTRAELRGKISTMPGLNRYLRVTPAGLLRIDAAAIKAETRLDGTWLLRCSDPSLSGEDIAAGYKQLLEVEYQLFPMFPARVDVSCGALPLVVAA